MRKSVKRFSIMMASVLVVMLIASVTAIAAGQEVKGQQFHLIDEDSGYSIFIPNFIEGKTIQGTDFDGETFEVDALIMERPQANEDGTYTIFEIITTDSDATMLDSYPGIAGEGQMGNVYGEIVDGHFEYAVGFPIKDNVIYSFGFHTDSGFSVGELFFMFVSDDATEEPADTEEKQPVVDNKVKAKATTSKVVVDGEEIAFEAYNINNNNFFKLRDLAQVVNGTSKQFGVSWDPEYNVIRLNSGDDYEAVGGELAVSNNTSSKDAKPTSSMIVVDGEAIELTAYNIGGNNYFKLRDVAEVFNFGVTWDGDTRTVGIDTTIDYEE